jgi:hypothetical protein
VYQVIKQAGNTGGAQGSNAVAGLLTFGCNHNLLSRSCSLGQTFDCCKSASCALLCAHHHQASSQLRRSSYDTLLLLNTMQPLTSMHHPLHQSLQQTTELCMLQVYGRAT